MPYNDQPRCFPTNSCTGNFLMTFSTSGHDRKCFRFLKNIIKVYIWHFFWLIRVWRIWWWCFQLPVITGSISGFPKTLKNVTSTNICLLVPHNCQPRCFFLPIHVRRFFWSYFQLPVITGSEFLHYFLTGFSHTIFSHDFSFSTTTKIVHDCTTRFLARFLTLPSTTFVISVILG